MMAHRALPLALRGREHCPPRLRELAVLRLAQLVGSAYEWSHHRPMALHAGVTARSRIIQALGVEVEADHQHHLIDWVPAGS
jgi:alkylhydroperoxidase family enzyme